MAEAAVSPPHRRISTPRCVEDLRARAPVPQVHINAPLRHGSDLVVPVRRDVQAIACLEVYIPPFNLRPLRKLYEVDGVHIPAHANVGAQEEDIITALLVRRPIERLGARPDGYPAIFAHPWFANSVTAAVLLRNQTVQPSPYMYEDFEAQLNSSMGTGNYDPGEDAE